jgi:hypothetical protein
MISYFRSAIGGLCIVKLGASVGRSSHAKGTCRRFLFAAVLYFRLRLCVTTLATIGRLRMN